MESWSSARWLLGAGATWCACRPASTSAATIADSARFLPEGSGPIYHAPRCVWLDAHVSRAALDPQPFAPLPDRGLGQPDRDAAAAGSKRRRAPPRLAGQLGGDAASPAARACMGWRIDVDWAAARSRPDIAAILDFGEAVPRRRLETSARRNHQRQVDAPAGSGHERQYLDDDPVAALVDSDFELFPRGADLLDHRRDREGAALGRAHPQVSPFVGRDDGGLRRCLSLPAERIELERLGRARLRKGGTRREQRGE